MIENLDPRSGIEYKTHGINPAKKIQRVLDRRVAEAKEDKARWAKDHPDREPGTSLRTWKSESQIRFPSKKYRDGFANIQWDG